MALPRYSEWRDTATALHMVLQMMGKIRLARLEPQPEWNHIVLSITADGFGTGLIPFGERSFSIDMHVREGKVVATAMDGRSSGFPLEDGTSVSHYYTQFKRMLADIGCHTEIYTVPQEMAVTTPFEEHNDKLAYDGVRAVDFYRMCVFAHNQILRFISPYRGKKMLPSLFWGTFDVTGILFSGKSAPWDGHGVIERVAFDEQMMEFGFWPGDEKFDDPAFFILPYPFIKDDLTGAPIKPDKAWYSKEKAEFFLKLEDVMASPNPEQTLSDFFTSGYEIIIKNEGWEHTDWYNEPLLTKKGSEALRASEK